MSAFGVKNPSIGRIFARISKVYNTLIYKQLQQITHKTPYFEKKIEEKDIVKRSTKSGLAEFIKNTITSCISSYCHFPPQVKAAFYSKFNCVLQEIALRFAGVSTAFCRRQHCVLQEIALRFARDSTAFSCFLASIFLSKRHTFSTNFPQKKVQKHSKCP